MGSRLVRGTNDLATVAPGIVPLWDIEANEGLTPSDICGGSMRTIYLRCKEKHLYHMHATDWRKGFACPYCSNKRVLSGYNDLATMRPDLISEWSSKNIDLQPSEINYRSCKKAWWHCDKCGGEYQQMVYLHSDGHGCPYCTNHKALPGFNDLQTKNPDLASEFDNTKNGELTASQISEFSGKKVWWRCPDCGHSYQATVANRSNGSGCPICHKFKSKGEIAVRVALQKYGAEFQEQVAFPDCRYKGQLWFDFVVYRNGEPMVAIEYNGRQHYQVVPRFDSDKDGLQERQARDSAKIGWCLNHMVAYMDIRWFQYPIVDDLIRNMLINLGVLDKEKYAFNPEEFQYVPVKKGGSEDGN